MKAARPRSKYAGWGFGAVLEDMRRTARRKLRGGKKK
jgi:hypothetical protein